MPNYQNTYELFDLNIGRDLYQIQRVDADPKVADIAWCVTKYTGDESYYLYQKNRIVSCECKGFLAHQHCKHVDKLVAVGLMERR